MNTDHISTRLKELRGAKSQAEVAKAVGITPAALSNYEAGIRIPRDDVKIRLAKYYRRSVNYIFFDNFTHEM